jgi:hypothetical protein
LIRRAGTYPISFAPQEVQIVRRPLTGALLGILIGLCVAIVLQQQGVWPLDRITVFLLPAVTGLLGLLLLSFGRAGDSMVTMIIALIILLPMTVWGLLGLADANENGELNGGCLVMAVSDFDSTTVTDTSKQDPFEIDADGGLSWLADSSPNVFMDYMWEIHVEIGGADIVLDSDTEPNTDGSAVNGDEIDSVRDYAADRDPSIDVDLLSGVHKVGGFADTCNGFGFVAIVTDGLSPVTIGAAVLAIILLIILIILTFTGRGSEVVESRTVVVEEREVGEDVSST